MVAFTVCCVAPLSPFDLRTIDLDDATLVFHNTSVALMSDAVEAWSRPARDVSAIAAIRSVRHSSREVRPTAAKGFLCRRSCPTAVPDN